MEDERLKRIKALEEIAKRQNAPEPELPTPHVSEDTEYFSKLKALKDKRREGYKEDSEDSFKEMLDKKDQIEETASSDLSDEEKEAIAAETLAKKRREMGIYNK